MTKLFKLKSLLFITSLLSGMVFFSCQKDNLNDASIEDKKQNASVLKADPVTYFSIQAPDGRYLSSENGEKPVSATRTNVGAWEKFELIDIGGRRAIIKGNNGKYLTQLEKAADGTTIANNFLSFTASREEAEEFFTPFSGLFPQFRFESLTHSGVNYALTSDAKKLASNANATVFTIKEITEAPEPIEIIGSSTYAVKTPNGKYLSSENGNKPASVTRYFIGAWEIITFEEVTGRAVYIKGSNGKYLTSVDGTKPLAFVANSIQEGERFVSQSSGLFPEFILSSLTFSGKDYKLSDDALRFEPVDRAQTNGTILTLENITTIFALKAPNGKYLSSENGKKPVSATRSQIGDWEKFEFISKSGRIDYVRGNNGKYLTSKNGTQPLAFTAVTINEAEEFFTTASGLFPDFIFTGDYKLSSDNLKLERVTPNQGNGTIFSLQLIN